MQEPAPISRTSIEAAANEGKIGSTRDRPNRASFTKRSYITSFGKISEQNRTRSTSDRPEGAEEIFESIIRRHASTPSNDPRYRVGPPYLRFPAVSIRCAYTVALPQAQAAGPNY